MAKGKGSRIQVILECTEAPGTSRYVTTKNRRTTTGRIEINKYNSRLRKHTLHKEIK
ncbi:MAG: 50S ribosomal protein L33 [Balneolales bacterium]